MKTIIAASFLFLQLGIQNIATACPEGHAHGGPRGGPLKGLDANKDEQLSPDEVKDNPKLTEKFSEIDTDKNGFLSKDELKSHKKLMKAERRGDSPVKAD